MTVIKDHFNVSYENGSFESYLVITACAGEQVLQYQADMIGENAIPGVLPLDCRRKDEKACFYYTITSKQVLHHFLSRRKLKREEFIELLRSLVKVLIDSGSYLLSRNSFVLEREYVFVDPSTLEVSLVYLPVKIQRDVSQALKDFLADLILHSADIEETGSDNFLQRVISLQKSPAFNIWSFQKLLQELKGSSPVGCLPDEGGEVTPGEFAFKPEKAAREKTNKPGSRDKKLPLPLEMQGLRNWLPPLFIIILFDFIISCLLYAGLDRIKSLGSDLVTTLAAFGVVVFAVDAYVLKKWKDRLAKKGEGTPVNSGFAEKGRWSLTSELDRAYERQILSPEQKEIPARKMDETTLLSSTRVQHPFLQSKQDGILEKVTISKSGFMIGRLKEQVDHVVANKAVGKVHAEILKRDSAYYIRDLSSRNGTFINGVKVDSLKEYEIKNEDKVSFANQDYVFRMP